MSKTYYAHGKLLLTGEYFVLDGATALALPTQLGQKMTVNPTQQPRLQWCSKFHDERTWFTGIFDPITLAYQNASHEATAQRLHTIFLAIRRQNPTFFSDLSGSRIETQLEFPHDWGLGSSSTLLVLLAQWSQTNPYSLLKETFGGSGYDIACGMEHGPLFYQKTAEEVEVNRVRFSPPFQKQLYFVYLGQKQNSREGIQRYRQKVQEDTGLIEQISAISQAVARATSLIEFEKLLLEHETIVAKTLALPRAKTLYFSDYWGEIKSLGAWGGDFVLATSQADPALTKRYFNEKGFEVVLNYDNLILHS